MGAKDGKATAYDYEGLQGPGGEVREPPLLVLGFKLKKGIMYVEVGWIRAASSFRVWARHVHIGL